MTGSPTDYVAKWKSGSALQQNNKKIIINRLQSKNPARPMAARLKIVETLHLLGALLLYLLSLTLQPPSPSPSPLISVASQTKKCWKLKQSTLKWGGGRGSGKGLNSRYGGYWKPEKVFFRISVSTILQLVVATAKIACKVET